MINYCDQCDGFGYKGLLWWAKPCSSCGGDGLAKPPGWPDHKAIEANRPRPPVADRHILFPQFSRGTVEILIQQGVITMGDIEMAAIRYRRANGLPLK